MAFISSNSGLAICYNLRCHCEPVRKLAWQSPKPLVIICVVIPSEVEGSPDYICTSGNFVRFLDSLRSLGMTAGRCGHRPLQGAFCDLKLLDKLEFNIEASLQMCREAFLTIPNNQ